MPARGKLDAINSAFTHPTHTPCRRAHFSPSAARFHGRILARIEAATVRSSFRRTSRIERAKRCAQRRKAASEPTGHGAVRRKGDRASRPWRHDRKSSLFKARRWRRGLPKTDNRLPYSQVSKEFPGKVETSTPYVIGKVVSRLETDSRWALARSVRALVAERDALREKWQSTEQLNSANG